MDTTPFSGFKPRVSHTVNLNSSKPLLLEKPLFTSLDIEKIFDVKKSTVEQWRLRGCGPKFIRLAGSRLIRYRQQDVTDFIESQIAVNSTTEADTVRAELWRQK